LEQEDAILQAVRAFQIIVSCSQLNPDAKGFYSNLMHLRLVLSIAQKWNSHRQHSCSHGRLL